MTKLPIWVRCTAIVLAVVGGCEMADYFAAAEDAKEKPPYANDPAITKQLEVLGDNSSLLLPPLKVVGLKGSGYEKNDWLARGPFSRSYCNKLAYAPERHTAFYCGQDHNLPHYNDCWELHLGSNTWYCLTPPDGGDALQVWYKVPAAIGSKDNQPTEKDTAKRAKIKEETAKYLRDNVIFENGYLQTKKNGGPVMAWHTWDGLTYDPQTRKMLWAALDSDEVMSGMYLNFYCRILDKDFAKEKIKLKPGMGMWFFDPRTKRWSRNLVDGPRPRMRGMGGSLQYVPDLKKSIWYVAAYNVAGGDVAMWTYDSVANQWQDLKPNGGKLAETVAAKQAPREELQVVYSPKHKKLFAIDQKGLYAYDLAKNEWSRIADDPFPCAHDAHTVFVYDSANDVLLLLAPEPGKLWAYAIESGK